MNSQYLFVYGLLRRGYGLNHILDNQGYIGEAWLDGYRMYDMISFPAIYPTINQGYSVLGEVYEIDRRTLMTTDSIELASGYRRDKKLVKVGNNIKNCWVYVYKRNPLNVHFCKVVKGGDWKNHIRELRERNGN